MSDEATERRGFFRDLPHLPFAQREQGRFRQREEEARAGEKKNPHCGHPRRQFHAREYGGKMRKEKGKNRICGQLTAAPPVRPGFARRLLCAANCRARRSSRRQGNLRSPVPRSLPARRILSSC